MGGAILGDLSWRHRDGSKALRKVSHQVKERKKPMTHGIEGVLCLKPRDELIQAQIEGMRVGYEGKWEEA